jgi:hypothetical protein
VSGHVEVSVNMGESVLSDEIMWRSYEVGTYTVKNGSFHYIIPQGVLHRSYHIIPLHYHGNTPIYGYAWMWHDYIRAYWRDII